MTTTLLILVLLIATNAFFAASEFALVELNDLKVKKQAEEGNRKAKLLYHLISEESRFLSTIQIGITLAGFLASAFAADHFSDRFAHFLYTLGIPFSIDVLDVVSVIFITAVLSFFTLVFGELVPKKIALQKPEMIASLVVYPLTAIFYVFYPLVKVLSLSTNTIIKLLGMNPHAAREEPTEEEIRMMVEIGDEQGTILKSESEMIYNIFEFNDKYVSDIFTHRTDMIAIPSDATLEETLQVVNNHRFTRYPVYEGDIDHIIGILHVKDLIRFMSQNLNSFNLQRIIRKPIHVFESIKIDVLFEAMQSNNIHVAIVVDEYGGTAGLVTIEDIIEEIVGEIRSEIQEEEEEIKRLSPNQYIVKGITPIYKLKEELNIELPSGEYDTLNGFLFDRLGHFPVKNEQVEIEYENLKFQIMDVDHTRFENILLTILGNQDSLSS